MILKIQPYFVFPALAIYYLLITKTKSFQKIFKYINWKLVFILAIVIILSNFAKVYTDQIMNFLKNYDLGMNKIFGFIVISFLAFGSSLLLGSSSRYAGIMVLLTAVYGLPYFTYFIALEFSGYLLSPMHKCNTIGKMYFNTPLKTYFLVIGKWALLLIGVGFLSLLRLFFLKTLFFY